MDVLPVHYMKNLQHQVNLAKDLVQQYHFHL